jgi:hypothetical protein
MDDYDDRERRRSGRRGSGGAVFSPIKYVYCPRCGHRNAILAEIGPESTCERCKASLRCCKCCAHYAPQRPRACLVEIEQEVVSKDTLNECPRFAANYHRDKARHMTAADARRALDKLFKL